MLVVFQKKKFATMNKFKRTTRKLYYEDGYLSECTAHVVKTGSDYIELDMTVAYPEGGGQEADHGVIATSEGFEIRFIHVRKAYATKIRIKDMPEVAVDGVIEHVVHGDDREWIEKFRPGMPVVLRIDVERRARLSLSHTASHLLYLGVTKVRPDAVARTLGCHIRTDAARFDFAVETRLSSEDLVKIEQVANALVVRDSRVRMYSHPDHPDARYWECDEQIIPCGGTHIDSTASVGPMTIRRKSLGKGKERIACEFAESILEMNAFHS